MAAWVLPGPIAQAQKTRVVTFSSTLALRVYARGTFDENDRLLGATPTPHRKPIPVPSDGRWYVEPLPALTPASFSRLVSEIQSRHIPGLDLTGHSEVSDRLLTRLRAVRHLRILLLARTSVTDKGLASLSAFGDLETLTVGERITDAGVAALRPLQALRELDISDSAISGRGLARCPAFRQLHRLILGDGPLGPAGITALRKFPRLGALMLGGSISEADARALAGVSSLRELDVSQAHLNDGAIAALAQLPHLETLYLNPEAGDTALAALSKTPHLRRLDLTGAQITSRGLAYLARCSGLEELALGQTAITASGLADLRPLPRLRALELSDTPLQSGDLVALAGFPALRVLSLSWVPSVQMDRRALGQIPTLKLIVANGRPLAAAAIALRPKSGAVPTVAIKPVPYALPTIQSRISVDSVGRAAPMAAAPLPAAAPASPALLAKPPLLPATGGLPADVTASPRSAIASLPKMATPTGPALASRQKPWSMPAAPTSSPARDIVVPADNAPLGHDRRMAAAPVLASARTGPLSGLRRLRELEHDPAALSDIATDNSQASIPSMDAKPENSLGEFTVDAAPAGKTRR